MVKLPLPLVGSSGDRVLLHVFPTKVVKLIELSNHEVGRSPIWRIAIGRHTDRRLCRKQRLAENQSAVQLFGQHLKDHSGERRPFVQLPEMRWAAPIKVVVAVVVRPDSVACRLQNVAMENVEAKPDQDIEIFRPHLLQRVFGELMNELFAYRFDLDAFNTCQQVGTVALT